MLCSWICLFRIATLLLPMVCGIYYDSVIEYKQWSADILAKHKLHRFVTIHSKTAQGTNSENLSKKTIRILVRNTGEWRRRILEHSPLKRHACCREAIVPKVPKPRPLVQEKSPIDSMPETKENRERKVYRNALKSETRYIRTLPKRKRVS